MLLELAGLLSALDALLDEELTVLLDAGSLAELEELLELAGWLSVLDALLDEELVLLLAAGLLSAPEVLVLLLDAGLLSGLEEPLELAGRLSALDVLLEPAGLFSMLDELMVVFDAEVLAELDGAGAGPHAVKIIADITAEAATTDDTRSRCFFNLIKSTPSSDLQSLSNFNCIDILSLLCLFDYSIFLYIMQSKA